MRFLKSPRLAVSQLRRYLAARDLIALRAAIARDAEPRGGSVGRHRAAADGHGPALRRRVRSGVAPSARRQQVATKRGKIKNDEIERIGPPTWDLFPGEIAYVWHGALRCERLSPRASPRAGFTIRAQIIWAKERLVMSQGDYHWQHEPCWYAVRKKGNWTGDRKQTTLWTIPQRRTGR